jgi:hypothetical protein
MGCATQMKIWVQKMKREKVEGLKKVVNLGRTRHEYEEDVEND